MRDFNRAFFKFLADHLNLFGIDEKYGPIGISIIRENLPKTAVVGHTDNEKNKKYQYRIVLRTCEVKYF